MFGHVHPATRQRCGYPDRAISISAAKQAATTQARPQVWLLGESLTQQAAAPDVCATALGSWYARKADVVNRGFSGYDSRWLLLALHKARASSMLLSASFTTAQRSSLYQPAWHVCCTLMCSQRKVGAASALQRARARNASSPAFDGTQAGRRACR